MLQWGHDFSTVEIWKSHRIAWTGIGTASMGPRFFNRGNAESMTKIWDVPPASMGPRFFNRGNWRNSRKDGIRRNSSFNGATIFQPWKFRRRTRGHREDQSASMGPRFFNRGNPSQSTYATSRLQARFNGATIFQPWK